MTARGEEPVDEELPAIDDQGEATADHPDEVTDEEAAQGQRLYEAVDDTDDEAFWPDEAQP